MFGRKKLKKKIKSLKAVYENQKTSIDYLNGLLEREKEKNLDLEEKRDIAERKSVILEETIKEIYSKIRFAEMRIDELAVDENYRGHRVLTYDKELDSEIMGETNVR